MNTQNQNGQSGTNKTETLFGGRLVAVTFNDGSTGEIKVRQLPLGEYERAFAVLDDEISLVALICGLKRDELVGTLSTASPSSSSSNPSGVTPESYELLQVAAEEVNKNGFFVWSVRRTAKQDEKQGRMVEAMATLPPDVIKLALEVGKATLPIPSKTSGR